MDTIHIIALALGMALASGINLYAAVFMVGLLGAHGYVDLPPELQILAHPVVIYTAGFMYCVEFFADKAPGFDTLWDTIHTFIRIPAGAVLAMSVIAPAEPAVELAAFLLGGTVAAGFHAGKAGSRVLVNTSPEPLSNWSLSLGEDLLVFTGLWLALFHPWLFLALAAGLIVLLIWLLPRIWRGVRAIAGNVAGWFSRTPGGPTAADP